MITQKQRDQYRCALEDKGVPEVLAYMAARNFDGLDPYHGDALAADLLYGGFGWMSTEEGHEFWWLVCKEAEEVCK